jgi:thiamine-phosphate pyrophosphorylase
MASELEAARLARLARALNPRSDVPPLILMTDEIRLPDPVAAARRLPPRCAVIVRHRDRDSRARLANSLRPVARDCHLLMLISDDAQLAILLGADGLHLPERAARSAGHWKAIRPAWLITAAAHSDLAIAIAARSGADAVLLGPVFPTPSHPERLEIGVYRALALAKRAPIPVYALGGVNARTARRLAGSSFGGFAAIDGLADTHNE